LKGSIQLINLFEKYKKNNLIAVPWMAKSYFGSKQSKELKDSKS
jgi:hypothetical protein